MEEIILNEFYFGKQPELLELEKEISNFREKFKKIQPKNTKEFKKDFSKQNTKIEKIIKKIFGFKDVHLGVELDNDNVNAFTIPTPACNKDGSINKRFLSEPVVIVNKKGMKFDPIIYPIKFLIFFTKGILIRDKITDAQVVSILLHEIGHNFARFIDKKIGDPTNFDSGTYADERFADQFVAMYGYSSELMKSLVFIQDSYFSGFPFKSIEKIPGLDIIFTIARLYMQIILDTCLSSDPHPYLRQRFEYQIQQLESDLKYTPDLSTKERKEAEEQLKLCKDLLYKYFDSKDIPMSIRVSRFFSGKLAKFIPFKYYQIFKANHRVSGDITNSNLKSLYDKTPSKDPQNKRSKKGFFLFK